MPIESIEHRREEAKSCVDELHVQKFWINTKMFWFRLMVFKYSLCMYCWILCSWMFYSLCHEFVVYAMCVWFLVECLKSKRKSKKWVSIVSLSEWVKFLQGVQWSLSIRSALTEVRVHLWKLRRDNNCSHFHRSAVRHRSRAKCA